MTAPLAFMGFGFLELIVVGIVALVVFGGELPSAMRTMGRAYAKFRQGLQEITQPVRDEIQRASRPTPAPPARPAAYPDTRASASLPAGQPSEKPARPSAIRARTPEDLVASDSSQSPELPADPHSTATGGLMDEPPPV